MLAKPRKLRFRVAYCSSEDPEFPARELNAHSPNTQGWLSARMCDYPQEIVVQFDGLVRLSALQILSNESRIAQKIELYVGMCENALESPSLQSASFRRLGYLSLDSNERSQYRARELKDVNLSKSGKDTRAQFLRLIIHENHINSLNIHGQVGIMAVNALGVDMHPFEQDAELEESLGGISNHQPMVAPNSTTHNVGLDVNFDPATAQIVRSLIAKKQAAVEQEQYDEAKSLKAAIETLEKLGGEISKLEMRKREVVAVEDYDEAKALKKEIDVYRTQAQAVHEAVLSGAVASPAPAPAQPPQEYMQRLQPQPHQQLPLHQQPPPQPQQAMQPHADPVAVQSDTSEPQVSSPQKPHARPDLFPAEQAPAQLSAPASAPAPAATVSPRQSYEELRPVSAQHPLGSAQQSPARQPTPLQQPSVASSPVQQASPTRSAQSGMNSPRKIQPQQPSGIPSGGGLRHSPLPGLAPTSLANAGAPPAAPSELPPDTLPDGGTESVEMEPEELSTSAQKEASNNGLFDVFDRRTIQCLYSKQFVLREKGINEIAANYAELSADKTVCLRATCYVLQKMFSDRIAQVFSAGASLLEVALHSTTKVRRADVADYIRMLLPALLAKTAETNVRVRKDAHSTLMLLAQNQRLGPAFVAREIVTETKKPLTPKQHQGRLDFLAELVAQCGIDAESPNSFGLDMVMPFVIKGIKNPNDKVRNAAVDVAAECYQQVGLAVEDHMTSLSAAQVETIHHAFQQIDMYGGRSGGQAGQRPPSQPSSRRPPSGGGAGGAGNIKEDADPFAAKPKVRNSFESNSGSGPGPDAVPSSRGQRQPVQNSPNQAVAGRDKGAAAGDEPDPFASKPKVRNSFDAGPSRHAPAPAPQPAVAEAPADYSMPEGGNPFETRGGVRNSTQMSQQQNNYNGGPPSRPYEETVAEGEEELEIPPAAQDAFDRGNALFEEDRCEEAKDAFTEAMAANHPDVASCLTERGRCYSFLGKNDEALQDYDEAIRLDPEDDILYQNRGTQLWIMGRLEEAERDFQNMIDINPQCDEEAKEALAKVREELYGRG